MDINCSLKTTILYGVFHPDDPDDCLYVGVTSATLKIRERSHWAASLRGRTNGKFPNWMRKHPEMRGVVVFRELASFPTRSEAFEAEIREISYRRSIGQAVLNTSSGGEGQDLGYEHTEEAKVKMSYPAEKNPTSKTNWKNVRLLRDEASRAYVPISELSERYSLCPSAVRNILANKTWVDAKYDPLSWKRKFHLTPLHIADQIREERMEGQRPRELARKYGVSESTVRSIVRNISRKSNTYDPKERPVLPAFGTKLNAEKVRDIRNRYAQGETLEALGAAFGVTAANISMIVTRKTWRDVR